MNKIRLYLNNKLIEFTKWFVGATSIYLTYNYNHSKFNSTKNVIAEMRKIANE